MKIAVGIIALILMFIVGIQSIAVAALGSIGNHKHVAGAGGTGVFVAFLLLVAGAFAFALPVVSMIVFALAGLIGVATGASTPFHDLTIWGVVCFVLAVLSFFAWRSDRKRLRKVAAAS